MSQSRHALVFVVLVLGAMSGAAQQIVVLSNNTKLTTIAASSPGTPIASVVVTGLQSNEKLLGIDHRPVNGQLYALGSSSRVYTIDLATGVATAVGPQFSTLLNGGRFGFDFNPTVDRIRITSDAGQNMRAHPITGLIVGVDMPLAYGAADPNAGDAAAVTGSAYTNSVAGATTTTLYDIDVEHDRLVTQIPPNNGTLNTVGPLGVDTTSSVGFDIDAMTGVAYASLTSHGTGVQQSNLFTINLMTGAASFIGTIGVPGKVDGLAVMPVAGVSVAGSPPPGCNGAVNLGVNTTATPGEATFSLLVTGAPSASSGVVAVSDQLLAVPAFDGGIMVLLDLASSDAAGFSVTTNTLGAATLSLAIPADPSLVGTTRVFQAGFADACAPGGVVVSPALSVTVMP